MNADQLAAAAEQAAADAAHRIADRARDDRRAVETLGAGRTP